MRREFNAALVLFVNIKLIALFVPLHKSAGAAWRVGSVPLLFLPSLGQSVLCDFGAQAIKMGVAQREPAFAGFFRVRCLMVLLLFVLE